MKAKDYADLILEHHAAGEREGQAKIDELVEQLQKEAQALYVERLKRLNLSTRFTSHTGEPRLAAIMREACSKWDAVSHRLEIKLGVALFPFAKGGALLWPALNDLMAEAENADAQKISGHLEVVKFMQQSLLATQVKAYNTLVGFAEDKLREKTLKDMERRLEEAKTMLAQVRDEKLPKAERTRIEIKLHTLLSNMVVKIDQFTAHDQLLIYGMIGGMISSWPPAVPKHDTVVESPP